MLNRNGILYRSTVAFIVVLLFPGCFIVGNEIVWLTNKGGSCTSSYKHYIQKTKKTPFGWLGIYRSETYCGENTPRDTFWSIVAFNKTKPKDNEGLNLRACKSCTLFDTSRTEIKNVEVTTSAPFWMNVSWENVTNSGGTEAQRFQYIYHRDNSTEVALVRACSTNPNRIPKGEAPTVATCIGPPHHEYLNWESWSYVAIRYLHGKPTMFDEQALKWIDEHRANPSDVVNGLKYFVETWRAAVDERTSATVGSLRALIMIVMWAPDHCMIWASNTGYGGEGPLKTMIPKRWSGSITPCGPRAARPSEAPTQRSVSGLSFTKMGA